MIERITYDETHDVLCVKAGPRIITSREAAHDCGTILSLDDSGQVVGLQVIEASGLSLDSWAEHPDRAEIPEELRDAVTMWIIRARDRSTVPSCSDSLPTR